MATHVSTMDQITDYLGIPLPGLEFSKMGYVAAYLRDPVNCCKPSVASIGQYFRHLSLKIGDRVKLQMASDLIQDRFYIQIQHGKGNCGRWFWLVRKMTARRCIRDLILLENQIPWAKALFG
ncbi:uncharacterized protein LOC132275476 isoform X3 [Cornus florida]|nr:uncharacterized protein LOC132275476 isoform X3 [Cornus florida]